MLEAFAKTGKFDKEIDSFMKKEEEKEKVVAEKQKIEKQHREENNAISKTYNLKMTKFEEILKPLRFGDEKKRNFLFHVICSHIPFSESFPIEHDDEERGRECCICKKEVISQQQTIANVVQSNLAIEVIKLKVIAEENNWSEEKFDNESKKLVNELCNVESTGYTSNQTTTVICKKCLESLRVWLEHRLLDNDGFVNAAIKKVRGI